jgi:hydrogenase expression/formation protein HypC
MKVIKVNGNQGVVEVSGIQRVADFSLVDSVNAGDYIIVHAGFAIQSMNEKEAKKTLALFDEMARYEGQAEK